MTCRAIIKAALRRLAVLGSGRDPSGPEATDALETLQGLISALPGALWWIPVEAAAAYTAGENERVRVTVTSAVTITIPAAVSSAERVLFCCNQVQLVCTGYSDRAPKDGARIQVAVVAGGATTETTYFYRADLGEWVQADSLALDSEVPVNADMHLGLGAMLAMALADSYGAQIGAATASLAQATADRMRARYGKHEERAVELALLNTSSNRNWPGLPVT